MTHGYQAVPIFLLGQFYQIKERQQSLQSKALSYYTQACLQEEGHFPWKEIRCAHESMHKSKQWTKIENCVYLTLCMHACG